MGNRKFHRNTEFNHNILDSFCNFNNIMGISKLSSPAQTIFSFRNIWEKIHIAHLAKRHIFVLISFIFFSLSLLYILLWLQIFTTKNIYVYMYAFYVALNKFLNCMRNSTALKSQQSVHKKASAPPKASPFLNKFQNSATIESANIL